MSNSSITEHKIKCSLPSVYIIVAFLESYMKTMPNTLCKENEVRFQAQIIKKRFALVSLEKPMWHTGQFFLLQTCSMHCKMSSTRHFWSPPLLLFPAPATTQFSQHQLGIQQFCSILMLSRVSAEPKVKDSFLQYSPISDTSCKWSAQASPHLGSPHISPLQVQ